MKATKINLLITWVTMTLIGGIIDILTATAQMMCSGVVVEPTTTFTLALSIVTGFICLTIYFNKKLEEKERKTSQNKGLNSAKDKE